MKRAAQLIQRPMKTLKIISKFFLKRESLNLLYPRHDNEAESIHSPSSYPGRVKSTPSIYLLP